MYSMKEKKNHKLCFSKSDGPVYPVGPTLCSGSLVIFLSVSAGMYCIWVMIMLAEA